MTCHQYKLLFSAISRRTAYCMNNCLSKLHSNHREQMGHAADVAGSSQTAHKEEGKAKEKGKEVTAHYGMTMTPSSVQSSRSGYSTGQRKQTDANKPCSDAFQCHDCTKLLMNINADLFVCTAVIVG